MFRIFALGRMATPGGWKDAPSQSNVQIQLKSTRGGVAAGRGRGRGVTAPAGLGDLFAGGFMPNPGALRGGRGKPR